MHEIFNANTVSDFCGALRPLSEVLMRCFGNAVVPCRPEAKSSFG